MIKFFKQHPNGTMAGLTIFFLAALVAAFIWGLLGLAGETNQILNYAPPSPQEQGFDLRGAAALNWKGLATSSAIETASSGLQNP